MFTSHITRGHNSIEVVSWYGEREGTKEKRSGGERKGRT